MTRRSTDRRKVIIGGISAVALALLLLLPVARQLGFGEAKEVNPTSQTSPKPTPTAPVTRSSTPTAQVSSTTAVPKPSATASKAQPSTRPTAQAPAISPVNGSDIVSLRIMRGDVSLIQAGFSGGIDPGHSARCETDALCYDPPDLGRAAWSNGSLPSVPGKYSVYVWGHSNRFGGTGVFNDLPRTTAGDTVVLTTKTGVFTYLVSSARLLPFTQVADPKSQFWMQIPNVLQVITCDIAQDKSGYNGNFVVTATLVSAHGL